MYLQYIGWWVLAGWVCINIVVPVARPLFVLWLFSIPKITAPLSHDIILKSIGKGELLWAAMSMAAATCHELFALLHLTSNPNEIGTIWIVLCIHFVIILSSAIFVGLGSMNNTIRGSSNPHMPDPKVFLISIVILILTISTFIGTHSTLISFEAEKAQNACRDILSSSEYPK